MKKQQNKSLVDDLRHVLEYEVEFSGSFATSMVIPGCPNPGLDIDGVGRVALPLTEQAAELIASTGQQAPYGRGADTVIDTTVRDTIQIDASNIHFRNSRWTPAIQKWVENEVWNKLGCAPFTSPPKCELYKLLLYKPGAHFLPHQDTEKAPGMFATLVVVLPSEFTGGQIHVSHGDESMTFDNAKDSAFETTVLAWYTDVTHEVKEITSGYRLALSYHLINTSPGLSPPRLPDDDSSLQHLREIFSEWSNHKYPPLRVNHAVAYAFTHEYSSASLQEVIFKGNDLHIASMLKHVGDAEGVLVLMGWLNAHVEGSTGDHGWQTYEGEEGSPEYGWDSGTYDCPVMSHVYETKFWVEDLRDMQGKRIGMSKIKLGDGSILPYRAFSGLEPDQSTINHGFWGNEGAGVEFRYKCAALVIFPKDEQLSLMLSSEGSTWALEELEKSKSEGPSKENCLIVDFLAEQKREDIMPVVLKIAIEWKDAAVWNRIIMRDRGFFLKQREYKDICDGWQAFKFDEVRPTFEGLFQQRDGLGKASMRFLLFVKEKLPFGADPQKDEWICSQAYSMLETFTPDGDGNMIKTCVLDIVRWRGLRFASSVILPRFLGERAPLNDKADFAMGLIEHKEELIALPGAEGQTTSNTELLDGILDKILEVMIPQVSKQWSQYERRNAVSSLLSICIPGNRMKSYGELLDTIEGSGSYGKTFYAKYLELYEYMVPRLVKLLEKHGISVSSSPSRKFFCSVIGTYLQEILGSKEGSPYLNFSMLACGHEACLRVNDFLRSEETRMTIQKTEEDEVKSCVRGLAIDGGYDLLEFNRRWGTQPYTVELIKNHVAEAAQHWTVRLADTRKMLESIGTNEEISQIMGERWPDVEKALEGSQAFVIGETQGELETEDAMVGIE